MNDEIQNQDNQQPQDELVACLSGTNASVWFIEICKMAIDLSTRVDIEDF